MRSYTNGFIHSAMHSSRDWVLSWSLAGATVAFLKDPRTCPGLRLAAAAGRSAPMAAIHNHVDKSPHLDRAEGSPVLSPGASTIRGWQLYKRGSVDHCDLR
jgi:hypothetical protein